MIGYSISITHYGFGVTCLKCHFFWYKKYASYSIFMSVFYMDLEYDPGWRFTPFSCAYDTWIWSNGSNFDLLHFRIVLLHEFGVRFPEFSLSTNPCAFCYEFGAAVQIGGQINGILCRFISLFGIKIDQVFASFCRFISCHVSDKMSFVTLLTRSILSR